MRLQNWTGIIVLTMILHCGSGAFAALIEIEDARSDAADTGVMQGWDSGWDAEPSGDFKTNETAPIASSQSNFVELLAWHQNIDLFSASNAIVLAHWQALESDAAVLKNLPAPRSHRLAFSRWTMKALATGLFVCGIAGWAASRLRRRTLYSVN